MKKIFIFIAVMGLSLVARAGDDTAATRLHIEAQGYDSINGGKDDFARPLQAVAVKFEAPIQRVGAYRNDKALLVKMSVAETRRIEALRQKLIMMYVRDYTGCKIDPNARWQLVVACDPDTGLTDGKETLKDLPSSEGIYLNRPQLNYQIVHGWYCLIDKKTKTVVLDKEVNGNGAVIDTALDDFSRKLVMDFADNIKAK